MNVYKVYLHSIDFDLSSYLQQLDYEFIAKIIWSKYDIHCICINQISLKKNYKLLIPLKRMAAPQKIAEAVYFMANASYITGEVVVVDGGLHLVL